MIILENDIDKYIEDISDNTFNKNKKFSKKQRRKVTIISKPQVEHIKLSKKDIDIIKQKTIGNELIKFRKKMHNKFTSENLNLLNHNIRSLKIKIKYIAPEILLLEFASGKYKIKKNKIELIKYFKKGSTNHEFLHMATSFYNKKLKLGFCGFQQFFFHKKESIGYGLNEGYTELLNDRYFKEQIKYSNYSYDVCKFFASKLEEIVGSNRMEKFYLNADLYGLYKYLCNFDEGKNVASFIVHLDYLLKHASAFNVKKQEPYYALIQCYLAKWYIEKNKQEQKSNNIDETSLNKNITNYIHSLQNEDLYIKNYIIQNPLKKDNKTKTKKRLVTQDFFIRIKTL